MKKIIKNSFLILITAIIFNCQNNQVVVEKMKDINPPGWHRDSVFQLYFKPDMTNQYDIFFIVRNDNNYPYSNIFLIASIEDSNKKIIDTLEYEMADAQGRWLGSGIWDLRESKLIYKRNFQTDTLPLHITVQQAVRKPGKEIGDEFLPGIKTIGVIIEKKN